MRIVVMGMKGGKMSGGDNKGSIRRSADGNPKRGDTKGFPQEQTVDERIRAMDLIGTNPS